VPWSARRTTVRSLGLTASIARKGSIVTATYTFDVFSSLDGYGSHSGGDWGGYWGKQGPELLDHRLALYDAEQRMVFGANTYRLFVRLWPRAPRSPRCVTHGSTG
jgi:hypothetical protein